MFSTSQIARVNLLIVTSIAFVLTVLYCSTAFGQALNNTIRIDLNKITTQDHPTDHLEVFSRQPIKIVKLPDVDTTDAKFLKVFYSWTVTKDPDIVIMILRKKGGQELYIDKNYDNDLTDDGPPVFFPESLNALDFEIINRADSLQRVRLRLMRKPDMLNLPDSMVARTHDKAGNLTSRAARVWGMFNGQQDFTGTSGTFFWDDRVTLRRGKLQVDGKLYEIGLFDWDNNGLFNDQKDLLLVDNSQSGHLDVWDESQLFKLNDVFALGARHFRLTSADKYGKWIDVVETREPLTFYYMKELDSMKSKMGTAGAAMSEIDTSWVDITASTIDGKTVQLGSLKGRFLLLNFWGEWCKPCIEEVPALVKASREYPRAKLQIVSFLRSSNLAKARETIRRLGISWPQLVLTPELEKRFKVQGFPTNILIDVKDKQAVSTMGVGEGFFKQFIR
jgi:thiol-disulfide isomerase/thioredoxin